MLADIRTLWIGGNLSRLEYICLNSFLKKGHNVYLYTYDEVKNVPLGVKVLSAESILSRDKIFTYGTITGKGKGSYAGFANYFRYEMLKECDNSYWVDMDVICLRPFVLNKDIDFGFENDCMINNAIVGSMNKNHMLFNSLTAYCKDPFKIQKWDTPKLILKKIIARLVGNKKMSYLPWGVTGPRALTGFIHKYDLLKFIEKQEVFYPVKADDWKSIFFNSSDNAEVDLSKSKCIHLWNEYLRREGLDKNMKFAEDSLYEILIKNNELDEGWLN